MTEEQLQLLVDRIKSRITNFGTPNVCWPWTGAKTKAGPRLQMMRTRDRTPFYQPVVTKPYGLVKLGKNKRMAPHKIVYEWSTPHILKTPKYRLVNRCGNTLCCNPDHWLLRDKDAAMFMAGTPTGDPRTEQRQECKELMESLLAVTQPRCYDDVANHPYMADFPPEMIKEVLRAVGKDHLSR